MVVAVGMGHHPVPGPVKLIGLTSHDVVLLDALDGPSVHRAGVAAVFIGAHARRVLTRESMGLSATADDRLAVTAHTSRPQAR